MLHNSLRVSGLLSAIRMIPFCHHIVCMNITPHAYCRFTVILYHSVCIPLYDTCMHVHPCSPLLCEDCHHKQSSCITVVKITMATAAFAGNEIVSQLFGPQESLPQFKILIQIIIRLIAKQVFTNKELTLVSWCITNIKYIKKIPTGQEA